MEMLLWRRMTKTSWIEKKTYENILHEINEERDIIDAINRRKIAFLACDITNFKINFRGKSFGKEK